MVDYIKDENVLTEEKVSDNVNSVSDIVLCSLDRKEIFFLSNECI